MALAKGKYGNLKIQIYHWITAPAPPLLDCQNGGSVWWKNGNLKTQIYSITAWEGKVPARISYFYLGVDENIDRGIFLNPTNIVFFVDQVEETAEYLCFRCDIACQNRVPYSQWWVLFYIMSFELNKEQGCPWEYSVSESFQQRGQE